MHAAEMIGQAINALESGDPLPAECARWLLRGFRDHCDGHGTLDECLGLTVGRGEAAYRPGTLFNMADRDNLILEAGAAIGSEIGRAARIIEAAIRHDDFSEVPESAAHILVLCRIRHGGLGRTRIAQILRGESMAIQLGLCHSNAGSSDRACME